MKHIRIQKGLDIPFPVANVSTVHNYVAAEHAGIIGLDYPFKPHFEVATGDTVIRGQTLFTDKNNPRIRVTSPVSGTVTDICRGARRAFESILLKTNNSSPEPKADKFSSALNHAKQNDIREYLLRKGAWTFLRTRPYSLVPAPESEPAAIFVNAIDTRPGAPGVMPLIAGREAMVSLGIEVLAQLTQNKIFFCHAQKDSWENITEKKYDHGCSIEKVIFSGKHPAGLSSVHIHYLRPASAKFTVWTIPVVQLADIGELFLTGILPNKIRFTLAGKPFQTPGTCSTIRGAKISEVIRSHLPENIENFRVIAGSILHGWLAQGSFDYLGLFHNQVSILRNANERKFLAWLRPGSGEFSITRTTLGHFRKYNLDWHTSLNGSPRAMVPIGNYERVMPMDLLPTQLLRALLTQDWETAVALGALELEEEDMSLLTYVCPGKTDYGMLLNDILRTAYKELT